MTIPNEVREEHDMVCKKCKIRKQIARLVDAHFDWIDCPYDCPNDYEHWKEKKNE